MTQRQTNLLFFVLLAIGIGALYSTGLKNQLVFDDARLTDGTIFGQYGSLLQLKARLVSYGSFVWLQNFFGEGWWKQRVFNIGLHAVCAMALYGLTVELLKHTQWQDTTRSTPHFSNSVQWAARLGVVLWAFNPVAVYAVAYLVQRSILMATLFVVLACWSLVRGLATHKRGWFLAALVCYLLAVASKEHAVTAVLLAVPLYVFCRRPNLKRVLILTVGTGTVLAAMGGLLLSLYGAIVGTVFDESSRAYAAQLNLLAPGIEPQLYPLSIINQAGLFFQYGLRWFLPATSWMSIDIRPVFPLHIFSIHLIGAIAWLCTLGLGSWLVLRRSNAWGLLGLCLLVPCLLFTTEFATVWLQDPFVLYRSYLWSITVPALVAIAFVGTHSKPLYAVVLIVAGGLAALSFERIQSLQSPAVAWADANDKIDLQAPGNAVGRWRPALNLGTELQDQGSFDEALRLFTRAEALGEPLGTARFNMGVSLQQLKKYPEAVASFNQALAKGFTEPALYYQRGEALYAMGRFADAFADFSTALKSPQAPEATQFTRLRQAESAVAGQNFDAAIAAYQILLGQAPDKQRYKVGLSMALVGKKNYAGALDILNPTIAARPSGPAYYARALTYFAQGDRKASAADLAIALRAEPTNPVYRNLERKLNAPKP